MSSYFVRFLATGLVVSLGCGSPESAPPAAQDPFDSTTPTFDELHDAIVDVQQTPAKRQSIGNCWLYATASWAESLHLQATDEQVNLSESYWTYWHWYEQIAGGLMWSNEISTGGSYYTASGLIRNYGYMLEGTFIAEESEEIRSARQASALAAINTSLQSGALSDTSVRTNRRVVREELDKAWGLAPEVTAQLDSVFGNGSRNFRNGALSGDTAILAPTELVVIKPQPSGIAGDPNLSDSTLLRATSDWREVSYPSTESGRRSFLARIQRALHDRQPVILTWFVDFNALDSQGRFMAPPATPGRQGGHMVVLEDYQVNDVPGFGTLEAGVLVEDPEALEAALSTSADIEFLRVKNSWGTNGTLESLPGHHDLYMAYLNGPVQQCAEGDPSNCWPTTPLYSAVFPAGY